MARAASLKSLGQQQQIQQQQIQQNDAALAEAKRQTVGRDTLSKLIQANTKADDKGKLTVDHQAIATGMGSAGFPDLAEAWLKTSAANAEALDKLAESKRQHNAAHAAAFGDLAYRANSAAEMTASIAQAAMFGLLDDQDAQVVENELEHAGPDGWKALKDKYQQFSPAWKEQQKELAKPVKIADGEILNTPERAMQDLPALMSGAPKRPNSQEATFDLPGVGVRLKGDYVPGANGQPGHYFYKGEDVTGKVVNPPPASVQVQNMTNAQWTDDQIDFYAKQVKEDASKMNLITGLDKTVRARIERRIADIGGNINKLSASSRTMREMATEVLPHIDVIQSEANKLNELGLLGPIVGRWREFVSGKIGAGELAGGNAENAKLIGKFRTDAGLMQTAVMKAHVGARGSAQMLDHFSDLLGAEKADISMLTGELASFKDWMKGYSQMGSDAQSGAVENWVRDPATGKLVKQ